MDFEVKSPLALRSSVVILSSMWCKEMYLHEEFPKSFVRTLSSNFYYEGLLEKHANNMATYLKTLPVPAFIRKLLLNIFLPIGQEIIRWLESHLFLNLYKINLFDILVWSPHGMIDTKATAQNLMKTNLLTGLERYRIACQNCFYEEICKLWPDVQTQVDTSKEIAPVDIEVEFWTQSLRSDCEDLMVRMGYTGFEKHEFPVFLGMNFGNYVFAQYFIEQLDVHTAKQTLKNMFVYLTLNWLTSISSKNSMVIYSLSHLNDQEQMEVLIKAPRKNLLLFIEWPLQDYFLELANKLWRWVSPEDFYVVQEELARKVSPCHGGQVFEDLYIGFWNSAPLTHKKYVINKVIKVSFLSRIIFYGNTDIIVKFLLDHLSPEEKTEMISGFDGLQLISLLLNKNRLPTLEILIEKCVTSQGDIGDLSKKFSTSVTKPLCSYLQMTVEELDKFNRILKNISERIT